MNVTGGLSIDSQTRAAEGVLAWRVHVLVERPARSAAAIAFLAAFCALLLFSSERAFFVPAVVFFLVSLGPFFFPTHYELTPEGPRRRILGFRTERRWEEFRSYAWGRDGARLSTSGPGSRLGNLRGFPLRFAGNRDEVLAYLVRHVPNAAALPAAGREDGAGRRDLRPARSDHRPPDHGRVAASGRS